MRTALFTALPPRKSGIADYSAALLKHLEERIEVSVFEENTAGFRPGDYDVLLYQIGNNPDHSVAYETALEHPGVVVLHECNLHHLIAELTIRRDDWDGYLGEVEYAAGPEALAYAQRVRALEVGPDYDGVPMLRRLLERSRGAIVHSRFVETKVREAGFTGPVAVIPHGAWLPDADRMAYRHRLGLDETSPLIGIFGFLKPYKRIAESLRAFRRLLHAEPQARMILVGDEHPDLPLDSLIRSLDLTAAVRRTGFTSAEDFTGYTAACDIVLNLRFPTVGESSGTLLRALGLGRASLVSDVGSFAELPADVCLKVPVDGTEEDLLFEYLNLLCSRPDLRGQLGDRARRWVKRECNWELVARRYAEFVEAVNEGREWSGIAEEAPAVAVDPEPPSAQYLSEWSSSDKDASQYLDIHLARLQRTLAVTPPGAKGDGILEMGSYLQITPALKNELGYGEVRGCYYGKLGEVDHKKVVSATGEVFECDIDLFDAEKDPFPYKNGYFATVICGELIEHLAEDPMHMMAEINRILRPNGHLVLTTPNIASLRAIAAILSGYHPGFFPAYIRPAAAGDKADARHNREYTPKEVARLLIDAGFEVTLLETGPFRDEPKPEHGWVDHLLKRYMLATDLRGDGIYAVGRKTGPVRERHPGWLYN